MRCNEFPCCGQNLYGGIFLKNRVQRSGLMDSLGGEKRIGSLEKRHGIVEKSLVEYVSCGKPSVQKG